MELVRLQKLISFYGYASRRRAEKLIKMGYVEVDGKVISKVGTRVPLNANIVIKGRTINRNIKFVYLALNKPRGYLCTRYDKYARRKLVYDLIENDYLKLGIHTVGRLDMMSEGLILLTNDGRLTYLVTHPSCQILKEYLVTVNKRIPYKELSKWKQGVIIKSISYIINDFTRIDENRVRIILNEGKKREIRILFESLGLLVTRLLRIRIGPITLGDLPPGKYRSLTKEELGELFSEHDKDLIF